MKKIIFLLIPLVFTFSEIEGRVIEYKNKENTLELYVYDPPILLDSGEVMDLTADELEKLQWLTSYHAYTKIDKFNNFDHWISFYSSEMISEFKLDKSVYSKYKNAPVSKAQNPDKVSVSYALIISASEMKYLILVMAENIYYKKAFFDIQENIAVGGRYFIKKRDSLNWENTIEEFLDLNRNYVYPDVNDLILDHDLIKKEEYREDLENKLNVENNRSSENLGINKAKGKSEPIKFGLWTMIVVFTLVIFVFFYFSRKKR